MAYKLLITDIDGTLAPNLGMPPRNFSPSQRLLGAVTKAIDKNISLNFCTGRDKDTVMKISRTLALQSPHIIEGGAKIISSSGTTLWVRYIIETSVNKIIKLLHTIASFSLIVNGIEIVNTIPTTNLDKITAVLGYDLSQDQIEKIKQDLSSCHDVVFVVNQDRTGNTVYITDILGTKAHGVKKLLELLDISKEQTIGIGDGNNDKPLLLECGLKIAMGNAVSEVKEVADFVAPDVSDDGVAYCIEKFVVSDSGSAVWN